MKIRELLEEMVKRKASDLHIAVGSPPGFRISEELESLDVEPFAPKQVKDMIAEILTPEQRRHFEMKHELDFAYSIPGFSRFRVNLIYQRGTQGAIFRLIPPRPFTIEELELPPIIEKLSSKKDGLIIITGPSGSGKSTTVAAVIEYINSNRKSHIITIEDPIEFLHKNKKSIIRQREVGSDIFSIKSALKNILRQDPDVLFIGDLKNPEIIQLAISAAETGHLVLATYNTTGASECMNRLLESFPPYYHPQILHQLSTVLEGIITQVLVPKKDKTGRSLAMEILVSSPAVRAMVRGGNIGPEIQNLIQTGEEYGMLSLNDSLSFLYKKGIISYEDAINSSINPEELQSLLTTYYDEGEIVV